MFKRVFSFILIVVMLVCTITACSTISTITAETRSVYFATHRLVENKYEQPPLVESFVSCPTCIEVDYGVKRILVINTHGTASYTFNQAYTLGDIIFFNKTKKNIGIGYIMFQEDGSFLLEIEKEDSTSIYYTNSIHSNSIDD